MTTPMPTIFDVNAQAEENEPFEPTAADYAGDPDREYDDCIDCGRPIPSDSLSGLCCDCDTARYLEEERQFNYGFNTLYYLEREC